MATIEPTKKCSKCGVVKALSEFGKDKSKKDGKTRLCRSCHRKQCRIGSRKYRNNPDNVAKERAAEKERRKTPESKKKVRDYNRTPEAKARKKEYRQRPEVKKRTNERQREYSKNPDQKAKAQKREQQPNIRAIRKKYRESLSPEQHREYRQRHRRRVEDGTVGDRPLNKPHVETDTLVACYESGMTTYEIAQDFDLSPAGITYRLKKAGVEFRYYRGKVQTTKDGHKVKSSLEAIVDDWLFDNGIEHEIEPWCPWAMPLGPKGGSPPRADFLVGETYIEVWGMMGNPDYETNRLAKVEKYRQHVVDLIELFPDEIGRSDFSKLERIKLT